MILEVARALYGLVESAWLWYQKLCKTLTDLGYIVTEADRGLFVKKVFRGNKVVASNIVSVHVDDLISAASPNAEGSALSKEFWEHLDCRTLLHRSRNSWRQRSHVRAVVGARCSN